MNITPEQADLLDNNRTPGQWMLDQQDPDEVPMIMSMRVENGLVTGTYIAEDVEEDGDARLIAAAPYLAQTIAGMRWQWGVRTDDEDIWADTPDQEVLVEQAAAIPGNHLLRRMVGPVETIEETPND